MTHWQNLLVLRHATYYTKTLPFSHLRKLRIRLIDNTYFCATAWRANRLIHSISTLYSIQTPKDGSQKKIEILPQTTIYKHFVNIEGLIARPTTSVKNHIMNKIPIGRLLGAKLKATKTKFNVQQTFKQLEWKLFEHTVFRKVPSHVLRKQLCKEMGFSIEDGSAQSHGSSILTHDSIVW